MTNDTHRGKAGYYAHNTEIEDGGRGLLRAWGCDQRRWTMKTLRTGGFDMDIRYMQEQNIPGGLATAFSENKGSREWII